jgi:hypothetical protein
MLQRSILSIGWPAFLVASALEMFVFMLFDPQDAHWLGQPLELERQGVYSISFFVFWILAMASSALTLFLFKGKSNDESDN